MLCQRYIRKYIECTIHQIFPLMYFDKSTCSKKMLFIKEIFVILSSYE